MAIPFSAFASEMPHVHYALGEAMGSPGMGPGSQSTPPTTFWVWMGSVDPVAELREPHSCRRYGRTCNSVVSISGPENVNSANSTTVWVPGVKG